MASLSPTLGWRGEWRWTLHGVCTICTAAALPKCSLRPEGVLLTLLSSWYCGYGMGAPVPVRVCTSSCAACFAAHGRVFTRVGSAFL